MITRITGKAGVAMHRSFNQTLNRKNKGTDEVLDNTGCRDKQVFSVSHIGNIFDL